ncbi:hypothetical protein AK812_SmicGene21645 [Symbiodinium microadriaticum]|uniref:C2 domain-containing protein n=1 Tax=Symbiodinium microadriaticum TaxID=2951 RepID=A0A1Q9DLU4_SYMMI|nr:hypothetical protein AK812_SmicGene21645 [Symbiodinium microadriaticum]
MEPSKEAYRNAECKSPCFVRLEIRPARSSGARLPLETKMMSMKDHDVNSETRAGLLRCFLDMHPFNTPELPRRPEMQSFEVRVSVFAVDNIKVYKDFGQRNDLFVQMKFRSVNMDGEESKRVEKTDIHRWANEDASFNQRFLFEMSAPCLSMGVEFSLMDFDRGVSSAPELLQEAQNFLAQGSVGASLSFEALHVSTEATLLKNSLAAAKPKRAAAKKAAKEKTEKTEPQEAEG